MGSFYRIILFSCWEWSNKMITRMMIGPLDDHTFWSAFTHFGLWQNLYDCSLHQFTTSLCILKCVLLTLSSTSNRLAEIWKGTCRLPLPQFRSYWRRQGRGQAYSIAHPWVPVSSPLSDTNGLSLRVLELLSWFQKRFHLSFHPSDPDTMTNTTQEAIASSSGK